MSWHKREMFLIDSCRSIFDKHRTNRFTRCKLLHELYTYEFISMQNSDRSITMLLPLFVFIGRRFYSKVSRHETCFVRIQERNQWKPMIDVRRSHGNRCLSILRKTCSIISVERMSSIFDKHERPQCSALISFSFFFTDMNTCMTLLLWMTSARSSYVNRIERMDCRQVVRERDILLSLMIDRSVARNGIRWWTTNSSSCTSTTVWLLSILHRALRTYQSINERKTSTISRFYQCLIV
jgi:hypothetical protein